MHYLFFDCETGGLDSGKHSLLTAYFGVYDAEFNLIDELDLQLKPENLDQLQADPAALQVTGINLTEHINDPQTITYEEGARKLIELFERNKIKGKRRSLRPCGQNIEFDIDFIKAQLMDASIWGKYVHYNTIDTLRILTFLQDIKFLPKELGKLESMVRYFNIPMGQAHNAKEDIRMTVDVYKAMRNMLMTQKNQMSGVSNSSLLEIIERS